MFRVLAHKRRTFELKRGLGGEFVLVCCSPHRSPCVTAPINKTHDGDSERESKFDRKWRVVQFFVNGRVFAQVAQLGAAQQMAMWG